MVTKSETPLGHARGPLKIDDREDRDFRVIIAHEISRLWRSESEMHATKEEVEYLAQSRLHRGDRKRARPLGESALTSFGAVFKLHHHALH